VPQAPSYVWRASRRKSFTRGRINIKF